MSRAQTDIVDVIIATLIMSIIVLVALAIFDSLARMGPQSGHLGEANQNLKDAVGTLPLAVGGMGMVVVIIGTLRALTE